jgi:L-fucose dehydrogenase
MNLGLEQKVILVTGGAAGIGGAITRAAAAEGAAVAIVDWSESANELQASLTAGGAIAEAIVTDVTKPENCRMAVDRAILRFGRLDGLVNNVGVNDGIGLEAGSPSGFVSSLERNLLHYYNTAHYALPALKQSRGAIVNIGSKVSVTGQGGTSGYAAAKGAILSLTREWAVELLPHGIRVNAVLPAEVMTPLYERWLATFPDPQAKLGSIVSRIPLGKRMTTPEEIAAMVVFLLSEKAGHITGQHLFVDGGYTHLDRALL